MCAEKSWPDCTFTWESEDQEHYRGSHLEPFYENVDHLFAGFQEIVNDAWPLHSFGDTCPGPHAIPAEWAKGAHLCWPNANRGLIVALRIGEDDNEVTNLFPFNCYGTQVSIDIQKVFVWVTSIATPVIMSLSPLSGLLAAAEQTQELNVFRRYVDGAQTYAVSGYG